MYRVGTNVPNGDGPPSKIMALSPSGEVASTLPQKPVVPTEVVPTSRIITPGRVLVVVPGLLLPSSTLVPDALAIIELGGLGNTMAVPGVFVLVGIGITTDAMP